MRRFALITVILAALALTASAAADPVSVQPLRDAGYTVAVASQVDACTTWFVSGHGSTIYINDCDAGAAALIVSLTNPNTLFEDDWQLNHPDQVQAAQAIASRCYSISRTAPATDQWRIVGAATDVTVAGPDLPGLASSLVDLRTADGTCPAGTTTVVVPSTGDGGTVTVPGAPTVTTAIATQAQQLAAAAATTIAAVAPLPEATPVDPATYTVVEAPAELIAETGIVGWVNTPYMAMPIAADDVPG